MVSKRRFSVDVFAEKQGLERLVSDSRGGWKVARNEELSLDFETRECKRRIAFLLGILCDRSASVSVRFCGLDEMICANGRFRGKPRPTDVLSFPPLSPVDPDSDQLVLGDILICIPVAVAQAQAYRCHLAREMERLILHGVSHLIGLDHERSDAAWRVQSALERALRAELRAEFGLSKWCSAVHRSTRRS